MPRYVRSTPDYHRNMKRVPGDATPCRRCGRPIKDGQGIWVEVTTDYPAEVIEPGDPRSNVDNVSQGCFPLGRDCYRKLEVR